MKSLLALSLCIIGTTIRMPDTTALKFVIRHPERAGDDDDDDDYDLETGEKKVTTKKPKPKNLCNCPLIYFPICANNITFLNQCQYECAQFQRHKRGLAKMPIQCTGACERCNYILDNPAIEYDTDYYNPVFPEVPDNNQEGGGDDRKKKSK